MSKTKYTDFLMDRTSDNHYLGFKSESIKRLRNAIEESSSRESLKIVRRKVEGKALQRAGHHLK